MMANKTLKPYVEPVNKEIIVKLSFLSGLTIKDICNDLLNHAIKTNCAMFLTKHFKRGVMINKLQFPAQSKPVPFPDLPKDAARITLTIDNKTYEYANNLHYATDVSVPRIIATMINFSMKDTNFFNKYMTKYLFEKMEKDRKKLLLSILKDINDPEEENESVASLIFYIADNEKEIDEGIGEAVEKFTSQWTTV